MKIKTFRSHFDEVTDTNGIESKINSFIKDKKVIDIKQSISPKIGENGETHKYFALITVLYE